MALGAIKGAMLYRKPKYIWVNRGDYIHIYTHTYIHLSILVGNGSFIIITQKNTIIKFESTPNYAYPLVLLE